MSNVCKYNLPYISVVIPLYNKERYIQRTLDSVLAQTFENFEIIIVNDGSTDNGPEIVKQFDDPRIKIINQKNAGVSAARNHGIKEAKAELIAFLDADDEWLPDFLPTIIMLRKKYSYAGAYATGYYWGDTICDSAIRRIECYDMNWDGIIPDFFKLRLGTLNSSITVIKKDVFNKIGNFPEGINMGEDLDMWIRLAVYYPIAYSNRPMAIRHFDDPNGACRNVLPEVNSPHMKTLEMIESDESVDICVKKQVRAYIARQQLTEVKDSFCKGRQDIALILLYKWEKKYGISLKWIIYNIILRLPRPIYKILRSMRAKIKLC